MDPAPHYRVGELALAINRKALKKGMGKKQVPPKNPNRRLICLGHGRGYAHATSTDISCGTRASRPNGHSVSVNGGRGVDSSSNGYQKKVSSNSTDMPEGKKTS